MLLTQAETSHLPPNVLVFDPGAQLTVIRDEGWFARLDRESSGVGDIIGGVNDTDGGIICQGVGQLIAPFSKIEGSLFPDAAANLLADVSVKHEFTIDRVFNHETDAYRLTNRTTGEIVTFHCDNRGLFVYCPRSSTECKCSFHGKKMCLTTFYQALGHTKANIRDMLKAFKLHGALGFPTRENTNRLIKYNHLQGCTVSLKTNNLFFDVMHPRMCKACRGGKSVEPAAITDPLDQLVMEAHAPGDLLLLDLVFPTGNEEEHRMKGNRGQKAKWTQKFKMALAQTIDAHCQFTMAHDIKSRSGPDIGNVVGKIIAAYMRAGHEVKTILFDCEGAFDEVWDYLALRFPKVTLRKTTPGRHVRIAERNNRTTQALWRTLLCGLEYPAFPALYVHAYKRALRILNTGFRSGNDVMTVQERFNGTKPSHKEFEFWFGELVGYHRREREAGKNQPRSETGIYLGTEPNSNDQPQVLGLTNAIPVCVMRKALTPVDMTTAVRNKIRSLAKLPPLDTTIKVLEPEGNGYGEGYEDTSLPPDQERPLEEIIIETFPEKRVHFQESTPVQQQQETAPSAPTLSPPEECEESASIESPESSARPKHFLEAQEPTKHPWVTVEDVESDVEDYDLEINCDQPEDEPVEEERTEEPEKARPYVPPPKRTPIKRPQRKKTSRRYNEVLAQAKRPRKSERSRKTSLDTNLWAFNLTIKQAKKRFGNADTDQSVKDELGQMKTKGVWRPVKKRDLRAMGKVEILPSSLFLKDKWDTFGKFEKLKSRCVCNGSFQAIVEGEDNASPTLNITTLYLALAIAAKRKMHKRVLDIGGAYLNADLVDEVFMRLNRELAQYMVEIDPDYAECVLDDGTMVVELKKALYGLRVAGLRWALLLSEKIVKMGYKKSEMDPCMYVRTDKDGKMSYILVYVDDLLVLCDEEEESDRVYNTLLAEFKTVSVKEGDKLSFIGIGITTKGDDIYVNQQANLEALVKLTEVVDTAMYPAGVKIAEEPDPESPEVDKHDYLSLCMRLMYLAVKTRPDILYAMSVLASRAKSHKQSDFDQLMTVVKYLNGTKDLCLIFRSDGELHLGAMVDASFNQHSDAKGHTGFLIFADLVGSAAILAKSKKQKTVADSSAEAELIAVHELVQHLIWVIGVAEEMGYPQTGVPVQQDNQATIKLASKAQNTFKGRSKFINRKYFSVHEHVDSGELKMVYVGTDDNVSDYLSKALQGSKFRKFRVDIMGYKEVRDCNFCVYI